MKYAYLVCSSEIYNSNRIFDPNASCNRDGILDFWKSTRDAFLEAGIELNTYDYYSPEKPVAFLLFSDVPYDIEDYLRLHGDNKKYLLIFESVYINRKNADPKILASFDAIFTYQDDLVDNKKYYKINYPSARGGTLPRNEREKFAAIIFTNKYYSFPGELFGERRNVVYWFQDNAPDDLDLYGFGWDAKEDFFRTSFLRVMNRFHIFRFLRYLISKKIRIFRGSVESKFDTLAKYKFAICYENASNIPGWITEKIFDCFQAGTVPIYLGAPNIGDHVPESCFVDRRRFASMGALYKYLKAMPESKRLEYVDAAEAFMNSAAAYQFTDQFFYKTLLGVVGKDIDGERK